MKRITASLLLSLTLLASPWTFATDQSAPQMLDEARKALDTKDYAKAIDLYQQSQKLLPLNAEIPYNLAVAQYRKGEYDKAAESLKQAISLTNNPDLRARSTYNLGNAAYAQTLKAMAGEADSQQAAQQSKDAQQFLKEAIDQYKKAIDESPTDEDAKANAELSQRLLTELQKQQQQQKQDQQKQDQQKQDQKDQQQQSSSQSQPDQQQQDQQQQQRQQQNQDQKSQDQKSPDQKSQDQQKDQQSQDQQKQEQQQQDQKKQDQSDQDKQKQPPPEAPKPDETKGDKKGMTREAAERLLQAVRDKEKQRRAELARREAAKYAPVDKDW